MRALVHAACAAVISLIAGAVAAQEPAETPTPPTAEPVPYTSLLPKAAPARPRPTPRPPTPRAAAPPASLTTAAPVPPAPSGARLIPGQPIPAAELEAFVDGVMREAMARDHIAGATVAIVQNGQVVQKKGYGFASLSPARRVDPDRTLFRIGSISKTFTWIGVMREVEAGRLRLNDPVNLYLPERVQVRDQGYSNPVRVRHLLSHSAGFEDRALGHLMERDAARERPLTAYLRNERPRRVFGAGMVSSYSNYGAGLAGQAVAYLADKTFERQMEETLFLPLGMRNTSFREPHGGREGLPGPMPETLAANLATGYRWTSEGYEPRPFEFIGHLAPAGSASSTAGDMARYMQMLLNGGVLDGRMIYGPRTAQAFRTRLRNTPAGVNGWRHGFMEYSLPGGFEGYGHAGATLSFMSNMVVVPALNMGVFVTSNTDTGWDLQARLPAAVIRQFYAPPAAPRLGDRTLLDRAGLYEGYYLGTRRAYGGLEGFVGRISGGSQVAVSARGVLTTTHEGRTRTWVQAGDPDSHTFVSTEGEERIAFQVANGQAESYLPPLGVMAYERAPFWSRPWVMAVAAALASAAALATLAGLAMRNRREFRQTSIQRLASLLQNTEAGLWIAALALFGLWASKTGDFAAVMFGWPGPSLIIASACALVASVLSLLSLGLAPAIWRGGRRVDSWSALRKAGYTLTALIYMAFAVLLGLWGALSPWSG